MKVKIMKNILVPTDFSIQSLDVVQNIVQNQSHRHLRIYLIHLVQVPTDLSELLFLKKHRLYQHVPAAFFEAVEQLRQQYRDQIDLLGLEFFYGNRAAVLNSIIENRKIDEVWMLENYPYKLPIEDSVNLIPLIDKCKVPVHKVQVSGSVPKKGNARYYDSPLISAKFSTAG